MAFEKAAVLLSLSSLALSYPAEAPKNGEGTSLDWQPCDLDFPATQQEVIKAHGYPLFCANLEVPLDYTEPDNGQSVPLQLIRVPATKEPVKGSIIFNPGGPGGSGVAEVSQKGPLYSEVFGGQWDVIGFDARGTGRTMPFACLSEEIRDQLNVTKRDVNYNFTLPEQDNYKFLTDAAWDVGAEFIQDCVNSPNNSDVAPYMSTAFTARDVLNIVDALNEDGLLRFWGRSYSTILGQTFAAMFPDRVGRMFLDSVVLLDDYYAGHWATVNRDTETSLMNYLDGCVLAGPEVCSIAEFNGEETTGESLFKEVAAALQDLLDEGVTATGQGLAWWPTEYTLYQSTKYLIMSLLYVPGNFGDLTEMMDALLQREWETLAAPPPSPPQDNSTTPEIPWHLGLNSFHAIACSDATFRADSPDQLYSLIRHQKSQGSFGDVFQSQVWPCAQWPEEFAAKEHFEGPFTGINTSNPILFANGKYDPITPLSGAWESSAHFLGSRMLTHGGHGHGVMNHPSSCTIKAIHDYFNDGTLPELGAVCEPDASTFDVYLASLEAAGTAPEDSPDQP